MRHMCAEISGGTTFLSGLQLAQWNRHRARVPKRRTVFRALCSTAWRRDRTEALRVHESDQRSVLAAFPESGLPSERTGMHLRWEVRDQRETQSTESTVLVWTDCHSQSFHHDKRAAQQRRCCVFRAWKSKAEAHKQNNRRHHRYWSGKTESASEREVDVTFWVEKPR